MSKYGVFFGPYFPAFGLNTSYLSVFSPNARKYGPEKTPYLDTFHAVLDFLSDIKCGQKRVIPGSDFENKLRKRIKKMMRL